MISAALIRHSQEPTKRDNKTTEGEELGEKLEYFLTRKPLAMRLRKMILPHPFFSQSALQMWASFLIYTNSIPMSPHPNFFFFGGGGGGAKLIMPGTASMSGQGEAKYIQSFDSRFIKHDTSQKVRLL